MRVNKIFYSMLYTVLPDCDLYKTKLHNREIHVAQVTAYFFIKHISHCPKSTYSRLIKGTHNDIKNQVISWLTTKQTDTKSTQSYNKEICTNVEMLVLI